MADSIEEIIANNRRAKAAKDLQTKQNMQQAKEISTGNFGSITLAGENKPTIGSTDNPVSASPALFGGEVASTFGGENSPYTNGMTDTSFMDMYNNDVATLGTEAANINAQNFGGAKGIVIDGTDSSGIFGDMTGAEVGKLAVDAGQFGLGVANYFQNKPILEKQKKSLDLYNEAGRSKLDAWQRHDEAMRAKGLKD